MFYEAGCYGRIVLTEVPPAAQERLAGLPGEWLEFDPSSASIVVRHTQPSAAPCLPTISGELIRILSEVPDEARPRIEGGDLFVHTESKGQLVRLRVEPGGSVQIAWAHPDYSRAARRAWQGNREEIVTPAVQRLNGSVRFEATDPRQAAREIQELADNFEGLYPEGEFSVTADGSRGEVQVTVTDLNLDVRLLLARLQRLAAPASLAGVIEVSSFATLAPDRNARFVLEEGRTWIQRPVLWPDAPSEALHASKA